ncbi:MAG: hypothetical protein KC613_15855 [Myxococcales bacterium]|nr:hypothetical protein [Myxococcales bacterium]
MVGKYKGHAPGNDTPAPKQEEDFRHAEEAHYIFHNQDLLAQLRAKLEHRDRVEALAEGTGISDEALLEKLAAHGLDAQSVQVLHLVPLLAVAWADGELQDNERESIMQAANAKGMGPGTPGHEILTSWLVRKPDDTLFEAWQGYIQALMSQLNDEQVKLLKSQIVNFARVIAESAGGFLGFGKVAGSEEKVLERVAATFDAKAAK